jgi:hypothetical protein
MAQELHFIEVSAGEWFYVLEHKSAPKDAWDWMENADAFGPFPTLEAAQDHEYQSDSDTSGAEIVTGIRNAEAQRLIDACRARAMVRRV